MARVASIDGRPTLVAPNRSGLPRRLPDLLAALRFISYKNPIKPTGTAAQCERYREHRLVRFAEGIYFTPLAALDLRLLMCRDCGAVCVRDVSVDLLPGPPTSSRPPARRDEVLGWYSGARANSRTYG